MISIESEERPWGRFFVLHDESNYKVKRIEVEPGGRLSYQYHHKRSEAWTIIEGVGTITLDSVVKDYNKGQTVIIPQGVKHRIENKGTEKIVFIEVQTGTYFGEDDIVQSKTTIIEYKWKLKIFVVLVLVMLEAQLWLLLH